ncbi:MAG: nicotinamide mononucleotide transporter, partial [Firmicutes bacterium]|nr:nicotinamide mononucleotide transporter [Bacillota bacterium]
LLLCAGVTAGYGRVLEIIGSNAPYLNSLGTGLCICAAYLSSRRIKEQWYFWLAYTFLLIALWLPSAMQDINNLPVLLQNFIFLGININGLLVWRKMYRMLKD